MCAGRHGIAETLYYQWRDRLLEGGKAALATSRDRGKDPTELELREAKKRIAQLERALGRKTYEVGGRGGTLAGLDVSVRVSRARAVVATGRRPSVVAKVAGISRQAIYRPRHDGPRRPVRAGCGPDDEAIVEVAKTNPTDGTRMVAAHRVPGARSAGEPQTGATRHARAQAAAADPRLGSAPPARATSGSRVPDELWHIDMTKVWTAQHGWVYLHAMVDCCTREITGWNLELRCRDDEAIDAVEAAVLARGVPSRRAHPGHRQRQPVHLARLPQAPVRAWRHAPAWRLPRPRVPGVHRVAGSGSSRSGALGEPSGRPSTRPDNEITDYIETVPPPAPLRARLPNTQPKSPRPGEAPTDLQNRAT